jgi:hypothetical protein
VKFQFTPSYFLVGMATGLLPIAVILFAGCLFRLKSNLELTESKLKDANQVVADKYRERNTCLKLNDELRNKVASYEAAAKKASEEPPVKCVEYHELFNSFTAGVVSTNIVTYEMYDKELRNYCNTNWKVNVGKNYAGAKLVDYKTFEVSRSRSGSLFMVTCDWAIPSALWCDKKAK